MKKKIQISDELAKTESVKEDLVEVGVNGVCHRFPPPPNIKHFKSEPDRNGLKKKKKNLMCGSCQGGQWAEQLFCWDPNDFWKIGWLKAHTPTLIKKQLFYLSSHRDEFFYRSFYIVIKCREN